MISETRKQYMKQWVAKNKDKVNAYARKWSKEHKKQLSEMSKQSLQEIKRKAIEYKGGRCAHCGLVDTCLALYEFHHVNPETKDRSFARILHRSWNRIKLELDKCILLCSNCHRKLHWQLSNEVKQSKCS